MQTVRFDGVESVLVVCTGNTCRSPLAAALLREALQSTGIAVVSAGLQATAGEPASSATIAQADRLGAISLATHRSSPVTNELLDAAGLVLTMTRDHCERVLARRPELRGRVFTLLEFAQQAGGGTVQEGEHDILDPYGRGDEAYAATGAVIARAVAAAARVLTDTAPVT